MGKKILLLGCGFLILFLFSEPGQILAQTKPLKVWVKTSKLIYRLTEEIKFKATLKNISTEPQEVIEFAIDPRSLFIEVTKPDKKKEKFLVIYGLKLQTLRLYPDKTLEFETKFKPEMAGEYTIEARYYGFGGEVFLAVPVKIFVIWPKEGR